MLAEGHVRVRHRDGGRPILEAKTEACPGEVSVSSSCCHGERLGLALPSLIRGPSILEQWLLRGLRSPGAPWQHPSAAGAEPEQGRGGGDTGPTLVLPTELLFCAGEMAFVLRTFETLCSAPCSHLLLCS